MFEKYDGRMVRATDRWGHIYTGTARVECAEFMFHEYGEDETGVFISGVLIYAGDIADIEERPELSVIRAEQTWQIAGAYYVRIQAMAKKHHITLRQEFDDRDGPDTKYIVVTDDGFPVATARMYPLDNDSMMIGRVVVLPEYRHKGIGRMVVDECEGWAEELHYSKAAVDSRDNKVEFYEQLGYEVCGDAADGGTFRCVRMEKEL